jgi:ubiquinone/menaquinone biosynthesis C-methylase UbiE
MELPYFDFLLDKFRQENPDLIRAFGRHVHWGYWEQPERADGSVENFTTAAEQMCQLHFDMALVRDSMRILDVGCGFGGTVASLNERFSQVELVGLNIDPRQLARARQQVQARPGNKIDFVEADACELPFPDACFDVVLAVECIFHFPSRARFFQEAKRVLRPGGRLVLSDMVSAKAFIPMTKLIMDILFGKRKEMVCGYADNAWTLADYRRLAGTTNLSLILEKDITANTMPTYPVVRQLYRQAGDLQMEKMLKMVERMHDWGLFHYVILSLEVQSSPHKISP